MTWRDRLRKGSFRGVEFYTDTSARTVGRRSVQHEYPNREKPFTEDLGRLARNDEIEGHVIGDDYDKVKKELIRVFEQEGPGELIHPYFGAIQVQVGVVTITESNLEGAIAKFSAKFYEAGSSQYPKPSNNKGEILDDSIENAKEKSSKDFEDNFSIAGLPAHAVNSARSAVESVSKKFNEVAKLGADISDGVTQLAFATRNLVAEVNDLLQAPGRLAARLLDSFSYLKGAFSKAEDQANAMSSFFNFGSSDVRGNTPSRNQERDNLNAFNNLIRRVASIEAAGSAASGSYPSISDALAKRDEISAVIENQLKEDDGTDVFQSLEDVRSNLVNALPDFDADLPNVKIITTDKKSNTLLLTYDIFENADFESDLIARNNIKNPIIIPAKTDLEVLSDS